MFQIAVLIVVTGKLLLGVGCWRFISVVMSSFLFLALIGLPGSADLVPCSAPELDVWAGFFYMSLKKMARLLDRETETVDRAISRIEDIL